MEYLAHINDKGEEQLLRQHLEGTALRCGQFADSFGVYDLGYCCGLLHDIGKYSLKFQKRLQGDEEKVDHSTAGAKLCWDKKGMYGFLSYCIAGHHAGLPDTGGVSDAGSRRTMQGRMKKKLENYQDYEKEIAIPPLKKPPFQPVKGENQGFFFSMLIRMLYSCLVDADYLDTKLFMKGEEIQDSGESIPILYDKMLENVSGWLDNHDLNTVNGRRTEILNHCLEMGNAPKGLFRLTVPTGGGKTISSLAFALRHAKEQHMSRVIYVMFHKPINHWSYLVAPLAGAWIEIKFSGILLTPIGIV